MADDWKVTRNFTINLGVRQEYFGFPSEVNGILSTYDCNAAPAAIARDSPSPVQDGFVFASNFDQAVRDSSKARARSSAISAAIPSSGPANSAWM